MKYEIADRFEALIGKDSFLRDIQICPEDGAFTNYDPKVLSKEIVKIAEIGSHQESDCNYLLFKYVYRAIKMAEQMTGMRGGNISGRKLHETVKKFVPDYANENPTYLEAFAALSGVIENAVQRSAIAKKHFFTRETPDGSGMAALIGADFDKTIYEYALWAHGEGFDEVKKAHVQNGAVIRALFSEYDDLCHPESRLALKDALLQYNDSLRKLKEDVIFSEIVKTLSKIGKSEKPYIPERAFRQFEKHVELARKHESNVSLALADSDARRKRDIEDYDAEIDALIGIEWGVEKSEGTPEEFKEEYQKILENAERLRANFDPIKRAAVRKEEREKATAKAKEEVSHLKETYNGQMELLDEFDAQREFLGLISGTQGYLHILKDAKGLREKYLRLEEKLHIEPEDSEDGLRYLKELIAEQKQTFETIEKYFGKMQVIPALEKEGIKDYIIAF